MVGGEATVQNHGTQLEDLAGGTRPSGCLKVFIQRDYSQGTSVKFQTKFPPELEGKMENNVFENTINDINAMFVEAEKMSCGRYCEGCLGCLTAYLVFFCMETHYEQMMKRVTKYVAEQNERVWTPRGLLITNPIERGLRVIEISILTEPATTRSQ
ncbi:golgin subfamily A member 7-like isoform X1 [Portunus trituberculatus]|uniref:golgin subfamily A member 7-like isoform X1 n=1 Tax=Portunus trituberculatus TaxID=210409 RepID=UPI001E1D078F|nr:golgin subfamily A member 7-like isoform X1 [Portunus trituberculatus]